jgi:hypothetical protein
LASSRECGAWASHFVPGSWTRHKSWAASLFKAPIASWQEVWPCRERNCKGVGIPRTSGGRTISNRPSATGVEAGIDKHITRNEDHQATLLAWQRLCSRLDSGTYNPCVPVTFLQERHTVSSLVQPLMTTESVSSQTRVLLLRCRLLVDPKNFITLSGSTAYKPFRSYLCPSDVF